jgi:putative ABC transport system permease protein
VGAKRSAIFAQYLAETALIGLLGGVLGLMFTLIGLMGLRSVLSEQIGVLTHIDIADVVIAMVLSVFSTIVAGLYPIKRAVQVQPAWQLKA